MNEIVALSKMSRRAFFKKVARRFLYKDWLCQIFAFFIVGAVCVGVAHFGVNLGFVAYSITGNYRVYTFLVSVYLVLMLLILLPLVYGLVYFEVKAVERGKGDLHDLFYPFSNLENLTTAYSVIFKVACFSFFCYMPAIIVRVFQKAFYYDGMFGQSLYVSNIDAVEVVIRSVFVLLLFCGFALSSKYFLSMFICLRRGDLNFRQCRFLADICIFGCRGELVKLTLSFLPIVVLSLFTFGLLFLLYTFPYILLTMTFFSKYLYDKEMYTKNSSVLIYAEENNNEVNNPKGSI